MDAVWVGIVVTIITFLGGALGLYLQKRLPEEHSVEKSRDMIGAVMGLVTLLLALVLGTIVGSAYFFSATQQSELQALSAQAIQLDQSLAQFGPEAKPLRDAWKDNLDKPQALLGRRRREPGRAPCLEGDGRLEWDSRAPSTRSTPKRRSRRTRSPAPTPI